MIAARIPWTSALLLIAFTLSGASALMLQILWTQRISVFFGVSAHAIATTVAAFMLGLGLGAWLGELILRRSRISTLKLYAISELVIILSVLVVQLLFSGAEPASSWLAINLPGQDFLALGFRFLMLVLLFFVSTCAMGASFPFFLGALFGVVGGCSIPYRQPIDSMSSEPPLGVFAQVLLMSLGISKTVFLACLLNLLAAAIAVGVDRNERAVEVEADQAVETGQIPAKLLYLLIGCSGFSAMAFRRLSTNWWSYDNTQD